MKFLIAAIALVTTAASAADIREGLYEISVRAELAGQAMTQAPMVMRQCVTQQSVQDLMSQMGGAGGCKVSNFQQSEITRDGISRVQDKWKSLVPARRRSTATSSPVAWICQCRWAAIRACRWCRILQPSE